jgi:hypothetical protein
MTGFGYGVRQCQQFHALQIPAQGTAGMTGVGYGVRERQQLYALQIPAQGTAGMTGLTIACANVNNFTRYRFPLRGLRE